MKTVVIMDVNFSSDSKDKFGGVHPIWARANVIFKKEGNKYRVLKNRYAKTGVCSKADIIKCIFG